MSRPIRSILFVCSGNICRSPTAEGIARARFEALGIDVELDSAGTQHYHVGSPPDPRACAVARRFGTPIDDLRARQVSEQDFERFDLILAADERNIQVLQRFEPALRHAELAIMPVWCGEAGCNAVPDPYHEDDQVFEDVYRLLQRCVDRLVEKISKSA